MNINKINQAICNLRKTIIEETGLENPVTQIGFSYEFYDWYVCEKYTNNSFAPSSLSGLNFMGIPIKPIRKGQENE